MDGFLEFVVLFVDFAVVGANLRYFNVEALAFVHCVAVLLGMLFHQFLELVQEEAFLANGTFNFSVYPTDL
jgi:hypothetical protein